MPNNNDSPIMFKSAVGGFDKKAVIAYIFELNESSQAAQKKLKDQLEEVTQAREALDQQLNETNKKLTRLQSDIGSLNNQLTGERTRNSEMSEELGRLNTEVEKQRELLAQKEEELQNLAVFKRRAAELEGFVGKYNEEIRRLQEALADQDGGAPEELRDRVAELEEELRQRDRELEELRQAAGAEFSGEASQQIADLRDTVESLNTEIRRQREIISKYESDNRAGESAYQQYQAKLEELEAKQKEIDRSSAQVGRLLLDATSDAEKMRTDAHEEGERLIERARQEAERIVAEAESQARAVAEDTEQTLAGARVQVAAFKDYISGLQERLDTAAADIQAKSQEVGRLAENMEQHLAPEGAHKTEGVFFRNAAER